MNAHELAAELRKLPKETKVLIRGGYAASDDAATCQLKIFHCKGTNETLAVLEINSNWKLHQHYNYPPGEVVTDA